MMHPAALRLSVLVTGAFLVVVAVWIAAARLAARVDTHALTPAEESGILRDAAQRDKAANPAHARRKEHP